jgi:hypothetical protein
MKVLSWYFSLVEVPLVTLFEIEIVCSFWPKPQVLKMYLTLKCNIEVA